MLFNTLYTISLLAGACLADTTATTTTTDTASSATSAATGTTTATNTNGPTSSTGSSTGTTAATAKPTFTTLTEADDPTFDKTYTPVLDGMCYYQLMQERAGSGALGKTTLVFNSLLITDGKNKTIAGTTYGDGTGKVQTWITAQGLLPYEFIIDGSVNASGDAVLKWRYSFYGPIELSGYNRYKLLNYQLDRKLTYNTAVGSFNCTKTVEA